MARVHGLQHVEGLGAAHLAHDDAVGAHAQGVVHQVALQDLAVTRWVWRAGFQADHVFLLQLKFGGVFDGDDPFAVVDIARHRVQHGCFPGTCTTRDKNVQASVDQTFQKQCCVF